VSPAEWPVLRGHRRRAGRISAHSPRRAYERVL